VIVLDSPKGWTGPKVVDGLQNEGTFRAHQVPLSISAHSPQHLRPARPRGLPVRACILLDLPDLFHGSVERRGHGLVHEMRLVPLDEPGRPTTAPKELLQLLARDPGEDGEVRNLTAVEMQDRQYGTVGDRVQELVGMPRRCEWAGFRFAIADHASDDQLRVVECGTERVAERVSELPALVDRARTLRRRMARNPTRKRELFRCT
jgi:hypothetical protein